jgi:acetoin utilization protein AcuC
VAVGLLYHDDFLRYDFGEGHALRAERVRLARELLRSLGMDRREVRPLEPKPATEAELLTVHDLDYVEAVKELSVRPAGAEAWEYGFGPGDNPAFRGMYEAASLQVGATVLACDAVMEGEVRAAFSLGGGFHHAWPRKASGFCIFNDPAVGLRHLLDEWGLRRVLYVDIDAHHGDGVQGVFYGDPRVLTISLHEDGRFLFPGTGDVAEIGEGEGEGYAANVPLPPYTQDASYLYAFREVVLPLARAFQPQILVTQCGADAHFRDPLTHLRLTTRTYETVAALFRALADDVCDGRWVAVTGGGYDLTAVPRVWTLVFSAMVGERPPDSLPREWVLLCRRVAEDVPKDGRLRDPAPDDEDEVVSAGVKRVVKILKERLFPRHGLAD